MGNFDKTIDKLAARSYLSYLARLQAAKRLSRISKWWNGAQFTLATSLVAVAIVFLGFPSRESRFAVVMLVVLSVLALVASFTIAYLDFSGRARNAATNYRALQAFSVRIETLVDTRQELTTEQVDALHNDYDALLDNSENHTSTDHQMASAIAAAQSMPLRLLPAYVWPLALPVLIIVGSFSLTVLSLISVVGSR